MSRISRWSMAVAAALAFAAPLSAQRIPAADVFAAPLTASMRALAPAVSLGSATLVESAATREAFIDAAPPALRRSQSVALMIVGGAGLIVGSLIDGDTGTIIMVGGGVAGLVGLFQYLR